MKHKGTQTLKTPRLILRKIELKDAQDLYELLCDEQILKYLGGIPKYTGVDMAISYITEKLSKKYLDKSFYDWGIEEKSTGKMVGRICVYKQDEDRKMADLVWYILPNVRGMGLMTEAAKFVVNFLQKIGFERIEAFANVDNISSQRVMEKIGMQYEGTLRKYDKNRDGSLYDAKIYSIVKD